MQTTTLNILTRNNEAIHLESHYILPALDHFFGQAPTQT
jgi:hypothetical protein